MPYSRIVSPGGITDADAPYFKALARFIVQCVADGDPMSAPVVRETPAQELCECTFADGGYFHLIDSLVTEVRFVELFHPDQGRLQEITRRALRFFPVVDHYALLDRWVAGETTDERVPVQLALGGPRPFDSDTFDAIARSLEHPSPRVRAMAAAGMASCADPDFIKVLERALRWEHHPQVAQGMREAIVIIGKD